MVEIIGWIAAHPEFSITARERTLATVVKETISSSFRMLKPYASAACAPSVA
jgi:hypothetical protein